MSLNQGQQDALQSALQFLRTPGENYMVIKGRAGTGKSHLTDELVQAIYKQADVIKLLLQNPPELTLHLTATTNEAAKILSDMTGEETKTIHSLLGLRIRTDYNTGETKLTRGSNSAVIENAVIIIDEGFNFDPKLLSYLESGTRNCKIIFIGDPYQCAPVRQTHSPIEDLVCRTVELTQVMRNGGMIQQLGEHWRNIVMTGVFTPFNQTSPDIIQTDGAGFASLIQSEYTQPGIDDKTNKIVCWTNAKSIGYSNYVRESKGLPSEFTVGEYVQIYNSLPKQGFTTNTVVRIKSFQSVGKVADIPGRWASLYDQRSLFIADSIDYVQQRLNHFKKAKDWKAYYNIAENIADLRSVHSSTVHKAQGNTFQNVFIDLYDIGTCNIASDVARMMHVAVTRPKEKVIFRGALPPKYGG